MRIKHYPLIVAFLAISMGIPLVQGCSDPFDEYGNGGTEMPVRDGWPSVSMSVEGLGLRNPLTRSLTPEGDIPRDYSHADPCHPRCSLRVEEGGL